MRVTVTSIVILAQASSSRLGESSWNSPWFCSSFSLRQPVVLSACVLVQASVFGFGRVMISPRQMVSPKRGLAGCHYYRPRSGDDA